MATYLDIREIQTRVTTGFESRSIQKIVEHGDFEDAIKTSTKCKSPSSNNSHKQLARQATTVSFLPFLDLSLIPPSNWPSKDSHSWTCTSNSFYDLAAPSLIAINAETSSLPKKTMNRLTPSKCQHLSGTRQIRISRANLVLSLNPITATLATAALADLI